MKFKVFTTFLLSVIIFSTTGFATFAKTTVESDSNIEPVIIYMTEEEIDEAHKKQAEEELLKLRSAKSLDDESEITPFNDPGDYKIEYGTKVTRSAEGFAGNQPSGGVRFPTLGGFYHSDSGGPTVSLNVSFPPPYSSLSMSVPLGSSASSGYFVNAPNKTDYFKLSVIKNYSIQPYNTYQWTYDYNSGFYYWKLISQNHSKILVSVAPYAKKVN
ncbi:MULTISPECIES: hypothetical protein [unclassified Sporosarcina]|uniref:hypothetical protein n=1 Tax=unclassified Sporosarcina TaxID=2647733 RepID=UPI001A9297C0|nr:MULTISPECIES: hypothetical protein [unclassified Sporosarcina]MBO0588384.1 hypothetical protein [Sporosarcina sp. E16_8]MBO0603648.1 hypothetical protein [Sporosarcina sp. E16_3]